jgi:hypothetical protein
MTHILNNKKRKLDFNITKSFSVKKRKIEKKITNLFSKKEEIEFPVINNKWIFASKTRNYMINDPILDWLSMYYNTTIPITTTSISTTTTPITTIPISTTTTTIPTTTTPISTTTTPISTTPISTTTTPISTTPISTTQEFTNFLLNQGNSFETYIINIMRNKFKDKFVEVVKNGYNNYKSDFTKTYELMKEGTPIIYQGFLYNSDNETCGYPDLIVRSDYISEICKNQDNEIEKGKSKFSNKWYYVIVDIKFSTFHLKSNQKELLKSTTCDAYKAQIYIYNLALSKIQDYLPKYTYLLGRGWYSTKTENKVIINTKKSDPFDKLITVNCREQELINKVNKCIKWLKDLYNKGHKWKIYPKPSRKELYPNMCNEMDGIWKNTKREISEKIGEITSIWNCGVSHRITSHSKKIIDWRNNKCTSKMLGIKGEYKTKIVDKILEINRGNQNIYYEKNKANEGWKRSKENNNYFIDFETISNINKIDNSNEIGNMIFMIGIGKIEKDKWEQKTFCSKRLNNENEKNIMIELLEYLKTEIQNNKIKKIRFYHYNFTEKSYFYKAIKRYNINLSSYFLEKNIEWIDLLKVIKDNTFIVKGALNFSLKSIISALHKHNLIDYSYNSITNCITNSIISNGFDAMILAFHLDKKLDNTNTILIETEEIKDIIKYNELDCKVLNSLLNVLQNYL